MFQNTIDYLYKYSRKNLLAILLFISIISSILIGFSFIFTNNQLIIEREAGAAQNYFCPEGTLSGSNCVVNKVATTELKCLNGQDPVLANEQCDGAYQNIIWPCGANVPGQILLIDGSNSDACTFSQYTSNFAPVFCEGGYNVGLLSAGDRFDRASRYDAVVNGQVTGSNNGPLISSQFCLDANNNVINPCLPDFRVILPQATNQFFSSGPDVLWCGRISALGGSSTNGANIQGDPLYFRAAGNGNSYLDDRDCGDTNTPGYYEIVKSRLGSHDEYMYICGKATYTAPVPVTTSACPDMSWTEDQNDTNVCFKAASPSNYTVDAQSIGNGSCSPNPVLGNSTSTFTCTYPLSGSANGQYIIPPETIYSGYWEDGVVNGTGTVHQNNCSVSGTNLVCPNIPAVNTSGADYNRDVFVHIIGVWLDLRSSIDIQNSVCTNGANDFPNCGVCPVGQSLYQGACVPNFTSGDLPQSIINCDIPSMVGSTTNCYITMQNNLYVTSDTKLRINDGDINTSTCIMTAPFNATCSSVSTGSQAGLQDIDIIFAAGQTPTDSTFDTTVFVDPAFTDFTGDCVPNSTLVNLTVDCSGSIIGDFIYIDDLRARISNAQSTNCNVNFVSQGNYNFTCFQIPVGSETGLQRVDFTYGEAGVITFEFDNVLVNRNATNQDYTLSCDPYVQLINESFNCSGEVLNDDVVDSNLQARFLRILPSQISSAADSDYVDCQIVNSEIICDPLPSGTYPGDYELYLKSDNTGENLMSYIRVEKIAELSDLTISCDPSSVVEGGTYDCEVSRPLTSRIEELTFKTGLDGQEVTCSFSNFTPQTCSDIPAGFNLGANDVYIFNNDIPQSVVDQINVTEFAKSSNITLTCSPESQLVNQTIDCFGTRSDASVSIADGAVQVANGSPVFCAGIDLIIQCTGINVGGISGAQNVIFTSRDNPTPFVVDTVNVLENAQFNDISLECSPENRVVNQTVDCFGSYSEFRQLDNLQVKAGLTGTTTLCDIDSSLRRITCDGVNVGSQAGVIDIYMNSNQLSSDTVFDNVTVRRLATEDDLYMDCFPSSIFLGETIDCQGGVPEFVYIDGIEIKVGDNGVDTPCFTQGFDTISCQGINTGNILGINDINLKSNQFDETTVDNVLIRSKAQESGININCNPDTTLINTNVRCEGEINPDIDITNLKIFIDPISQTPCSIVVLTRVVSCSSLNVGPNSGTINIFGKYDQDQEYIFIDDVIVNRLAEKTDLIIDCEPELTLTNTIINCSGSAPQNTITGDFVITLDNDESDFASCTQDSELFTIACEGLNSGNTTGLIDILASENSNDILSDQGDLIDINIIDKIQVFSPATSQSISSINCSPNPTEINSFVDCDIELDGLYIDVTNFSINNQATGDIVDCGVNRNGQSLFVENIKCSNLPSGDQSGFVNIGTRINEESEFRNGTQITVLSEPDTTNVNLECGDEVVKGGLIYCSGTIDNNVNLKSLKIRSDLTDQVITCNINGLSIFCPGFSAPSETDASDIVMEVAFNGEEIFNEFDTLALNDKITLVTTGASQTMLFAGILGMFISSSGFAYTAYKKRLKLN